MSVLSDVVSILLHEHHELTISQIAQRLKTEHPEIYGSKSIDELCRLVRGAALFRTGATHNFIRLSGNPARYTLRDREQRRQDVAIQNLIRRVNGTAQPQAAQPQAAQPQINDPMRLLTQVVSSEWFANGVASQWLNSLNEDQRDMMRERIVQFADRVFETRT
jgi:hypothetical protein